jgi:hypothetical protein
VKIVKVGKFKCTPASFYLNSPPTNQPIRFYLIFRNSYFVEKVLNPSNAYILKQREYKVSFSVKVAVQNFGCLPLGAIIVKMEHTQRVV